jgi:hypothetical protein
MSSYIKSNNRYIHLPSVGFRVFVFRYCQRGEIIWTNGGCIGASGGFMSSKVVQQFNIVVFEKTDIYDDCFYSPAHIS